MNYTFTNVFSSRTAVAPEHVPMLTLEGHKECVNVLRFHPERDWLLSGDEAGIIKLWNLSSSTVIESIVMQQFGPVTALVWVRLPLTENETQSVGFVAGFGLGIVALWKSSEGVPSRFECVKAVAAHEKPVEDLAFDRMHYRLASAGAGYPQVWSLASGSLLAQLTPQPRTINPYFCSSVNFCDGGASLLVTYAETHSILKFTVDPWKLETKNIAHTRIGSALVNGDSLFIGNLQDGVDQYSLRNQMQRIGHYHYVPTMNVPLQICLARQSCDWVVLGGDDGKIRLFDRNTGALLRKLEHGTSGRVQVVDAVSSPEKEMIGAAASELQNKSDIVVWYLKRPDAPSKADWIESMLSLTIGQCLRIATTICFTGLFVIALFALLYYMVFLVLPMTASRVRSIRYEPGNPTPPPFHGSKNDDPAVLRRGEIVPVALALVSQDKISGFSRTQSPFQRLPSELICLVANCLDAVNLTCLRSTCRAICATVTPELHKACGLQPRDRCINLSTHSDDDPSGLLMAFKAFRSFHRRISASTNRVAVSFFENENLASIEAAVEHFCFGLSLLPPDSLNLLMVSFWTPLENICTFLPRIMLEAQRQRVGTLDIHYPFAMQPLPTLIPSPRNLSLRGDLSQMWGILRSASEFIVDLSLEHYVDYREWDQPDAEPSFVDYTCLIDLYIPHLELLTITAHIPTDQLAQFIHQHQGTLRLVEIHPYNFQQKQLTASVAPRTYTNFLECLSGPADYLADLLGLFSAASLKKLKCNSSASTRDGCSSYFEAILACFLHCKQVQALEIKFPGCRSEFWGTGVPLCDDDNTMRFKTSTSTVRFTLDHGGPSNSIIQSAFLYWYKQLPDVVDVQLEEWKVQDDVENRRELLHMLDDDQMHQKISIKSGEIIAENKSPIRAHQWVWCTA